MCVPPLAFVGPSKGVSIATPSAVTPIAPYVVVLQDQPPITHVIPLSKPSKEEEEEVEVVEVKIKSVRLAEVK